MKNLKLESLCPRSIEAKLDKFLPRKLPLDFFLEVDGVYVGLVESFRAKSGFVDELFVLNADYHASVKSPGESDYDEFHTSSKTIERSIDISIRMLNEAFDRAGISRRHRMPLLNQVIATARFEAQTPR